MKDFRISFRVVLIVWAIILVFGLAAEIPQAEALDDTCLEICNEDCGDAGCDLARSVGCDCFYTCADGSFGSRLCTL